ncbi:hypothetical protein [Oceaniferula spumae]
MNLSPASACPDTPEKADTAQLIRILLAQDLGTRKFPFSEVIHSATGKQVLPLSKENSAHAVLLEKVNAAARATVVKLNAQDSPVRKLRRINEASRYFEDGILEYLNAEDDITCEIPKNAKGNEQRSGYPDLLITHTAADGTVTRAYLDPKLFEEKSRSSSLRTFYYEPREHTNKIQYDALHLLIGISHDGNNQAWTFTGWEICDLSHFHVRLKAEFQASNKDLYRPNIIKSTGKKP